MRRALSMLALLVLTLGACGSAGEAAVLRLIAKAGAVPRFEIVVCRTGPTSATARLFLPDGTPLCGPVPIIPVREKRFAFLTCQIGPRTVTVTVIKKGSTLLWTAVSGSESGSGLICLAPGA